MLNRKKILFFTLLFVLVFADILTKWMVVLFFRGGKITVIPHLVEIVLFFNNGGVFGLGNNVLYARLFLIFFRFLFLLALIIYSEQIFEKNIYYRIGYVLAYAGCIGNLIDTLFYWKKIVGFDGVIDWINFPFFNYVFNLADAYVTLSLFFIILGFFIEIRKND